MKLLIQYWRTSWQRRLVCIFIGLLLIGAIYWILVDWNGARQFRKVEAMLRAEGETLDFYELKKNCIPDNENYCSIPILREVAKGFSEDLNRAVPTMNPARLEVFEFPDLIQPYTGRRLMFKNASLGQPLDLADWAQWLRVKGSLAFPVDSGDAARDLLTAFSRQDSLIRELEEGLDRPHARWIMQGAVTSPMSKGVVRVYTVKRMQLSILLHAVAATHSSDATAAHTLALILLRLEEACMYEDVYISRRFSPQCVQWEICNKHLGSYDDFVRMEMALSRLDTRQSLLMLFRSLLAREVSQLQCIKTDRSKGVRFDSLPNGIFDQHCARISEREFRYRIKPLKNGWHFALDQMAEWEKKMASSGWMEKSVQSLKKGLPQGLGNVVPDLKRDDPFIYDAQFVMNSMYTQQQLDQALIACALERHRITHGDYPESLEAVKRSDGTPLPLDVFSSKPLNYKKTKPDAYKLWSVGENGIDDGGVGDDSVWLILGNSQSGSPN